MDPERPVFPACRILDDDNRFLQCRFDDIAGLLVLNDEPSGQAVAGLFDCRLPRLRNIGLLCEVPDPAGTYTEAWTQSFS
jgi:hypothetical protein